MNQSKHKYFKYIKIRNEHISVSDPDPFHFGQPDPETDPRVAKKPA